MVLHIDLEAPSCNKLSQSENKIVFVLKINPKAHK